MHARLTLNCYAYCVVEPVNYVDSVLLYVSDIVR